MSYELRDALLIYRSDREGRRSVEGQVPSSFVTKHAVQLSPAGAPILAAGAPLERSDLDSLLKSLRGTVPVEFLPENVLVRTQEAVSWFVPPAIRPMFYAKNKGDDLDKLSGKNFPQPALLFIASQGKLAVRALACKGRPTTATPLFLAPYWNVYDSGDVCLGSTKVPREASVKSLPRWEQSFFESEFTHSNSHKKLTKHPDGFVGLWKSLVGKKKFPVEYMATADETLQQFISRELGTK